MHISEQELAKLLRQNLDLHLPNQVQSVVKQPPKRLSPKSQAEEKFLVLWTHLQGPPLEREYRFDPTRRYRIDFYHAATYMGVEIEGGTWVYGKSRHSSPQGYARDAAKYFLATMQGITVLRLTTDMITVPYIQEILEFVERKTHAHLNA